MASSEAILTAFSVLEAAGLPKPKAMEGDGIASVLRAWCLLTADTPDEDLVSGAVVYARSDGAKFWPSVGQVLAAIPGRRNDADDSDIAWGRLLEHVRRYGWPNPPGSTWELDSPAMAEGLRAVGGWRALCALEEEASKAAARASFRSAYRTTAGRERAQIEGQAVRQLMQQRGLDTRQIGADPVVDLTPGAARIAMVPRKRGER